jgi:hypothetical protein
VPERKYKHVQFPVYRETVLVLLPALKEFLTSF